MKVMTINHLLAALLGLGSLTLGIVAWDFERMIDAVEALRVQQAQDHTQVQISQGDISELKPRVRGLEIVVQEHENRIVRMEPRP